MAKVHSEEKHKAHSAASKKSPDWVEYKAEEIEQVIVDSANAGMTPAQIGMTLRDQYGIPNVKATTGLTVEKILAKHKLLSDIPRDLLNLITRSVVLQKHIATNKKDQTAKRGLILAVSRIRRLTEYYQKKGKLDKAWRYTPETAALLVK